MKEKLNFAQRTCLKLAGKAMHQTKMIKEGDKIAVAVSGGMDSFVLLKVLQLRQRIVPFNFDIIAIHIDPGFDLTLHLPLVEWLKKHGIAGHIEITEHGPIAHSDVNLRNSACYYCAKLRRQRLFELSAEYNCTHLAFGHNADDLVTNFFMNLYQNGRVDGMKMSDSFFNGVLQVIRPLLLVEKKYIASAVKTWQLPLWSNPCPSAGKTNRDEAMRVFNNVCADSKLRRKNIYNGLGRWELERAKI